MSVQGDSKKAISSAAATPRMFDNPVLEFLSRTHPVVPPLLYLPLATMLLLVSASAWGWTMQLALLPLGYLLWTLVEYWGHRLLFHAAPKNPLVARLHWTIHGVHHDYPSDPLRLVMPPLMSLPIMGLVWFGLVLLAGPTLAGGLMAGVMIGYVGYDMLHYHVHHHAPRTRLGRLLRRLHMHHHFHDDEVCFGVSAPWWDHVFGTAPQKRARRASDR
jgi:sterol desaturase/sphingolipid hydroxylase (fatty acid hydroxylase superfamily)